MNTPILLSNREREVVKLLLQGQSNKQIALALGISNRTVEFHLKNIYAKFQVSSRVELILKLGNTTGGGESEKLGNSTVVRLKENVENKETISIFDKEFAMKNLLTRKHMLVGAAGALFAGFTWLVLMRYFVHMSVEEIQAWIIPAGLVWILIGVCVGWIGKRIDSSLLQTGFSTLAGAGFAPLTILPLMGFLVLPLGKFAEWLGFIDRTTISNEAAQLIAITAMLVIWLVIGIMLGTPLLFVTIKRPVQKTNQMPLPEHGR
jgi:DNA-binding CsgD family transcriptional regulator